MQILTLAQWRKLRGLSQEEMAKKVNVSTRTIWSYENDINNLRNASYNTISLIANALEIRTGKIFSNNEFGEIRTLVLNNGPWFVGKDVAGILKYERPTKAVVDLNIFYYTKLQPPSSSQ